MSTADILTTAADVLERDGWRNDGQSYDEEDGCRCVAQAIYFAVTGLDSGWPDNGTQLRYLRAVGALAEHIGLPSDMSVFRWNDRQDDVAPVLAALRATAEAVGS